MKALVTGSTGFIGLNIIESLLRENHEVLVYVRENSNTKYLDQFQVGMRRGELSDRRSLQQAMTGVDGVIHTAGNTSCFNRDYDTLFQVNVEGTRSVVEAAIAAGVKRLVYTSTTSTIGARNSTGDPSDENRELSGFRARSPYARTKRMAEQLVLSAIARGLEVVILNPAEVIGAYDHNFQWGRMVMAVFADRVPFIPPGGGSFCSAREVGRAHVAALTRGKSGERYILAGEDKDYAGFLTVIEEQLDKKFSKPDTHYGLMYWREKLKDKFYPLLGREFMVEPYRLKVFGGHYYFSSRKAQQDLDYQPVNLKAMIADCVDWYRAQGILPA
jgi:dihydroflavonol-4-reductase